APSCRHRIIWGRWLPMWFTRLSCSPRKLAPGTSETQGTSSAWSMRAIASLDQSSSCAGDGCGVSGRMVGFIVMLRLLATRLSAGSACCARRRPSWGWGPAGRGRATLATSSGPARGRRREPRQRTPPECRAARPSAGENPSAAGRGLNQRRAHTLELGESPHMVVGEIWRYPVKSMAGEQLGATMLTANGISGDRVVHARDARDVLTARSHPALLGFHGSLGPDDEPLVDGEPWSSESIARRLRQAVGPDVRLARFDG